MRRFFPEVLALESTLFMHRVISHAISNDYRDIFHCLAKDVPTSYRGSSPKDRLAILNRVLITITTENHVTKERLLFMIQSLHDSNELCTLARKGLGSAARYLNSSDLDPTLDPQFIALLTPHLLDYATHPAPEDADELAVRNAGQLYNSSLFAFVQRLTILGHNEQALTLFQDLSQQGLISDEDMQGVDLASGGFHSIVLTASIKACVRRNWLTQALDMLSSAMNTDAALHQSFAKPIHALTQRLLERRDKGDLEAVAKMITRVIQLSANILTPKVVSEFYVVAQRRDRADLMESVYCAVRKAQLESDNPYPPPSGRGLFYLLHYSCGESKNYGAVHLLTKQVVDEDIPIPPSHVARFIAGVASSGFAEMAKILWTRYLKRPNAELFLGNPSTMLRLVSLFTAVARRWEPESFPSVQPNFPRVEYPPDNESSEAVTLPDIENEALVSRVSEIQVDDETVDAHIRAKEARHFADVVIQNFRTRKSPLESAPHYDLNALARAYFITGQLSKGFATLKYLLDRKEVPNLQDVTVAISGMASFDPRGAFRMVCRMVKYGLKPNAVTFGTIIHNAIVHNDMELVSQAIAKAGELNITDFTYKTLGTLLRSVVLADKDDPDVVREELEKAQEILGILVQANFMPSPRMAIDCIAAALRADDPVMAFKFWSLFVKDQEDWDGPPHTVARTRISASIRKHCLRGSLDRDLGRTMLSTLGMNESVASAIRQTSEPDALPSPPP